jgi:hypothetical protein
VQATPLGTLACPAAGATPFTMTVTESSAYVAYTDSRIYQVDLATLACTLTAFDPAPIVGAGSAPCIH